MIDLDAMPSPTRALASLALVSALLLPAVARARDRPMVPMAKLMGQLVVSAREQEPGVRRFYQGKVLRVEQQPGSAQRWMVILDGKQPLHRRAPDPRSQAGAELERPVKRATPDRDRFTIELPERAAVPLEVGDEVRAEIWTARVGAPPRDIHARLWKRDRPLLAYGSAVRVEPGQSAANGVPLPPPHDVAATLSTALLWAQPD